MKLAIATITLFFSGAVAFAPSTPTFVGRGVAATTAQTSTTVVFQGGDDEEGGLDLDLGEMFDMFDAADKGEDFDKAIKDVKKEKES
eukprot:CAMPEP_0183772802 /NCGR_PEP_ID=MMETSP0739-20130205/37119_1 /TAXON_ID=385413 /ORGANISM="Thalassiosira miniscula, Strain CCMP1093" /LENGTH=86 /DNA_ID=CAMNT_0026013597 /DNA_START=34 /DNA_END=294 /DNA_ORIENTATION=-